MKAEGRRQTGEADPSLTAILTAARTYFVREWLLVFGITSVVEELRLTLCEVMNPLPKREVVVEPPVLLRPIVPSPNFEVLVVDPVEERLIVPEPKRLVVTLSPVELRVMAPSPNLEVR